MRFDVLTIFPDILSSPLQEGVVQKALTSGIIEVNLHNIRDFAFDKHAMTDDRPFGGGEGMVMKPEPIARSINSIDEQAPGGHVIMLSPQGKIYDQQVAQRLAGYDHLILLCGRYEGIDERIHQYYVHEEISLGDYVLTGGELGALILIDSISRLLPGVLGCSDSADGDIFSKGILKHPQYTRPREFENHLVPEILLSGDHAAIKEWRFAESVKNTAKKRPELLEKIKFTPAQLKILKRNGVEIGGLQ